MHACSAVALGAARLLEERGEGVGGGGGGVVSAQHRNHLPLCRASRAYALNTLNSFQYAAKQYRSLLLLMLQHALHIQSLPIITVLPCGAPLSQLLTNPGHLVAADLGIQAHLSISSLASLSQFGLSL